MKTKSLLLALAVILILQSCSRSFTPYQAANNPRGKKCGYIR